MGSKSRSPVVFVFTFIYVICSCVFWFLYLICVYLHWGCSEDKKANRWKQSIPFLLCINPYGSSAGTCCPSGVRLYKMASNSLRVYWRSAGSNHSSTAEMVGSSNNFTCTASPGENSCDVPNIQCGDMYAVVVAPLTPEGSKVQFCPQRLYSGISVMTS